MPRGPRVDAADALHHVIARGIDRCSIFRAAADRADFLDRLADLATASRLSVYAWALMTTHVPLLLRPGAVPLSRSMQSRLGGYAGAFNSRHRRVGSLFQSRFKSIRVDADPYLLELVRYIHLNPLRAGMIAALAALDQDPWTGHAVLLGHHARPWQDTDCVLRQFATPVGPARRLYRAFIADALAQPAPDLDGGGLRRSLGFWQHLGRLSRGRERWAFDERILGSSEFVTAVIAAAPAVLACPIDPATFVNAALAHVATRYDLRVAEITTNTRRRAVVRARALVCYAAVQHAGLPARRVAPLLGITPRAVLQAAALAARRCSPADLADPQLHPPGRPC